MIDTLKVNRPAPLKNVAAFSMLLQKMVDRRPDEPGLACFHGPSGWGKTKAAIYGANRYRATYVECGQFTTARSLLAAILMELGQPKPRGSIEDMKNEAIMLMVGDSRRPLIVDEAHFVASKRFVDVLRELSDKSGAPVIMIGEETLPVALERFERVHNRVLKWLPAEPCDDEDFKLLVDARCHGVSVAPDLAAEILAQTKGNTRRIVVNLSRVMDIAAERGCDHVDLAAFGGPSAINTSRSPKPRKGY